MAVTVTLQERLPSLLLSVAGKLTTAEEGNVLLDTIEKELAGRQQTLVLLNLQELSFLSSAGLNVLIRLLTKVRTHGGELALYGVHGFVEKLLNLSKLNEVFIIASSAEEALSKMKQ